MQALLKCGSAVKYKISVCVPRDELHLDFCDFNVNKFENISQECSYRLIISMLVGCSPL